MSDDESTEDSTIDEAIDYVKSLNLNDIGYSYLEEACLNELEGYKDDDVALESYTVLVPKARAKTYYGTYNNTKFYYDYTSVAGLRRETVGTKKNVSNASTWSKWIKGGLDLSVSFLSNAYKWTVPYSIISALSGLSYPSEIHNGSYNKYVEQFTKVRTRTVYKLSGGKYVTAYQDQSGSLRTNQYFCPVGTKYETDFVKLGTKFNGTVKANKLSKNQILKTAYTYSSHNSKVVYKVTSGRIKESWR